MRLVVPPFEDPEPTDPDPIDEEATLTAPAEEDDPLVTVVAQEEVRATPPPPSPSPKRHASGPRRRVTLTTNAVRDAIEQRYREERQWDALVELYVNRLEATDSDEERVELLRRVAAVLADQLGDFGQAFDALIEALAIAPRDERTAARLESVARKMDQWPMLVQELKGRLDGETDDARALRYAELLARWHRTELADPEGAEPYLARIRAIDPSHPLVLRRMASHYREMGARDEQVDALQRALLAARRDSDRAALHVALAELHETRARDLPKAVRHFEAALALPADDDAMTGPRRSALLGLERACRVREDYVELAHVLERLVEVTEDDEDRARVLLRLAEVHERHFVKPQNAAPKLEQALALAKPDDSARFTALDGLERCYHGMRAWRDLARTIERRVERTRNALERCDLLMRVADVLEGKLGDVDAALAVYRRVHEIDDGHRQALIELARLSEKRRDWTAAAAYRSRLADLIDDARARAQAHYQIADMLRDDDRDPTRARLHYEKATQLDPTHAGAWDALRDMALRAGDAMHAVHCLEQRAERTESPRVKAQLLVDLARMKTALGDPRGAFATYDYARRTDPSNEVAARAVFDGYVAAERWAEAAPVCDLLLAVATREGDAAHVYALLAAAGRIARALGDAPRALLAALAAHDMQPGDRAARDALIDACHALRDDAATRARTRDVLAKMMRDHGAELGPDALVRLAEIRRADGADQQAVEHLLRALTLDAEHARALEVLGDLFAARGDWQHACSCRQRLALLASSPEERRARAIEVAELWEKRAKNPAKAALLLEELLVGGHEDAPVLAKLVAVYKSLELWDKLLDALRAIADMERDPLRRAKTLFAMAGVLRDKIGNARRAAQLYDEVVVLDRSRLDAFERVVRIHTELRDWSALRAAYERMIARARAGADARLLHALYHQLGLVHRDRLGDAARALDAFRCAMELEPQNDGERRIVVELLAVMDQGDVAVATVREAIRRDPLRAPPYRELAELFTSRGAWDGTWCAADALRHLGAATPDEARFLADYPPLEAADVPGTLAKAAWRSHILHPDLDRRVSAILRVVTPAMLRMRFGALAPAERAALLGPPIRGDECGVAGPVVALVQNVAEILGVPAPAVHARAMPAPFAVAPCPDPTLWLSLAAVESIPPDLWPFLVARRIGELSPELMAHALFPTVGELRGLLKAALRVAVAAGTNDDARLKPSERALARAMSAREVEALRAAVSLVVGSPDRVEMKRWLALADASLSRVGLLLSGDLTTALRAVQREARAPNDLPAAEWRKEMLRFAVSDTYLDLRGAIGVGVGSGD